MSVIKTKVNSALFSNIKPGILLWMMLVIFFISYENSENFQNMLACIELIKIKTGFMFSFISYACFGAIIPEILKMVFLDKSIKKEHICNIIFGIFLWGLVGIYTDAVYKFQQILFGYGTSLDVLIKKTAAEELFFSPLGAFAITSILFIHKNNINKYTLIYITTKEFFIEYIVPVIIALWLVWIPGMFVVYSMPSNLQLPVASFILCFWSLVITFMARHDNS